jgi:archaemetzincin
MISSLSRRLQIANCQLRIFRLDRSLFLAGCLLLGCGFLSCREGLSQADRAVIIQPFSDFPKDQARIVYEQIRQVCPKAVLRPPLALPNSAFYASRGRYRADSLIRFLKKGGTADSVVIGLTTKDISTTKDAVADWGVMGLAYRPGNACVVSSFRLSRQRVAAQFFKVAIHELGHTQGLPHCPEKTCFMRSAEGGNPTDKETGFCSRCAKFLKRKGWRLQ